MVDLFNTSPGAPFIERLSGLAATFFAVKFCAKMSTLPMRSEVWFEAKAYYSPEALAQRAANYKLYFDKKYPERPFIITRGDREWPN